MEKRYLRNNFVLVSRKIKSDDGLLRLIESAKTLDDKSKWYFSRYEKWKFLRMIPHMQQFAFEEGAKIKVKLRKSEGCFAFYAQGYCFANIGKLDSTVLNYMKGKVVTISRKKGGVEVKIVVVFKKRRKG